MLDGNLVFVIVGLLLTAAALGWLAMRFRRKAQSAAREAEQATQDASAMRDRYAGIIDPEQKIAALKREQAELARLTKETREKWEREFTSTVAELEELSQQVTSTRDQIELESFGLYEPVFDFDTSERYKDEVQKNRQAQKAMIKEERAAVCSTSWTVDGNAKKGERMTKKNLKLLLRAFNGECDAAIAKARFNNVVRLQSRLTKAFDQINKIGEPNHCRITPAYLKLKVDELHLAYEYALKKHEEKEEQKRLREEMREQERAEAEIAKAEKDAEKEEAKFETALAKARADLEAAATAKQDALRKKVALLEEKLNNAHDRKESAIARGRLTKSGHVYIISNIGSFGDGVYKIGMTRRLDPLDRVKELGDASVPFRFDVHAMIYAEDAPALESDLQKRFTERQVNLVNQRREFFRVSLDEIEQAVVELRGSEVEFVRTAVAQEFRESAAIRRQQALAREQADAAAQDAEVKRARSRLEELKAGWHAEPV